MSTVNERTMVEELIPLEISPPAAPPSSRVRWSKALTGTAIALILVAAGVSWKALSRPAAPSYASVKVRRGNIVNTISATGKIQAVTTVQVGTQVSGTVSQLYADFN